MDNPFSVLKGQQLASVIFIQDYLQLDFDGFTLSRFDWPIIYSKHAFYKFGDIDYRNLICSFISKTVSDVIFIDNSSLDIYFLNSERISIDLRESGKELIYFISPSGEWSSI